MEWVKFPVVSDRLRLCGARPTPLWEFDPTRSNTVLFRRDPVKKKEGYYGALKPRVEEVLAVMTSRQGGMENLLVERRSPAAPQL